MPLFLMTDEFTVQRQYYLDAASPTEAEQKARARRRKGYRFRREQRNRSFAEQVATLTLELLPHVDPERVNRRIVIVPSHRDDHYYYGSPLVGGLPKRGNYFYERSKWVAVEPE